MKRFVRMAALAALAALPACTVFHSDRRTMTEWNFDLIEEHAGLSDDDTSGTATSVIDFLTVEPVALAMLPVSILADTLILNPIDAWKCAEMSTHYDRDERHPEHSNEQAAHYDYQVLPPYAPPAQAAGVLAWPRLLGRWLWYSAAPVSVPCSDDQWHEYWNSHKEKVGY